MQKENRNKITEHASIDELLEYRDQYTAGILSETASVLGETAGDVVKHIDTCLECQSELKTLSSVGQSFFTQVDALPSDEVWQKLQASLYDGQTGKAHEPKVTSQQINIESGLGSADVHLLRPNHYQSLSKAIYALAASVAFVGVVAVFMFSQQQSSNRQTQLMQASINELMINSRGLEQSLQAVALQNRSLSESNQRVADRLYWKLTYVDQLIHDVAPEDSEQVKTLWNDRVEALNELKQIYFERDSARETSEI